MSVNQLLQQSLGCMSVHVYVCACKSEYQQLPWGCVPEGSRAQVPPNGEIKSPRPPTVYSVRLRPTIRGNHTVYMYILSINRLSS